MKQFILIITILFASVLAHSQTVRQTTDGNYIAVKAVGDTVKATNTGKTYTDSKGQTFPVFISKNGKLFINRISRNTGKRV